MFDESGLCPNCNAKISVSDAQLFVYCMYCGVKIQTRDTVEVRHIYVPDGLEKMLSDGATYYKVENFHLAEKKFREVIKQYPKERRGYEELIRTLTKDQTVFPLTHETEVLRLLHEAEQLAPEEEKAAFATRRKNMLEAFEDEHKRVKQAQRDREIDMEQQRRSDRLVYSWLIVIAVFIIVLLMVLVNFIPPIEFSVILVMIAGGSYWFLGRNNS